jgi:hypothetical protein
MDVCNITLSPLHMWAVSERVRAQPPLLAVRAALHFILPPVT